jgi:hypothetical protein
MRPRLVPALARFRSRRRVQHGCTTEERSDRERAAHAQGFMGVTGGAIAGAFGNPWFTSAVAALQAAGTGNADLVVSHAGVYTVDERLGRAAFAVTSGRFIAVGTDAEIKGLVGKGTRTFDASTTSGS